MMEQNGHHKLAVPNDYFRYFVSVSGYTKSFSFYTMESLKVKKSQVRPRLTAVDALSTFYIEHGSFKLIILITFPSFLGCASLSSGPHLLYMTD